MNDTPDFEDVHFFYLYVNPGNNNEQKFRTNEKWFITNIVVYLTQKSIKLCE